VAENPYRRLPSVDKVLAHESIRSLAERSPVLATELARRALADAREAIAQGQTAPAVEAIAGQVADLAEVVSTPSLRRVINATGVILQTNLGRAPVSEAAAQAMAAAATGYSNLEFDLDEGARGSRNVHLSGLIAAVTGAEAGLAVNNNAAAVLLVLSGLAAGREVIISRGQAVEIGGGFRIPDVMRQSGTALVEVGTTNRTYMGDYQAAVGPDTAALLRVHASNFRVTGFVHQATVEDMARVAREHGLLLIDDAGSGCLLDVTRFGLAPEPAVQESIAAGADLCLFSGDKLLGGPQAGIIAGRGDLIGRLERHPLARALRADKVTMAGLQATLLHYIRGEALDAVPVWRMILMPLEAITARAHSWANSTGAGEVLAGESMIGGGSLPGETLPTMLLELKGDGGRLVGVARRLRAAAVPVVARVRDGALLLDPRTVDPADDGAVVQALKLALAG
jgi:L-seryl-tRNA(Ser) seleniumtransferase